MSLPYARYAKRVMADAAMRHAVQLLDESKSVGGPSEWGNARWKKIRALAVQAAEQLRLSESEKS